MKIRAMLCAVLSFASVSVCSAQSYNNPHVTSGNAWAQPNTFAQPKAWGSTPSYSSPSSDVQVNGYTRSNGTYVQPHHQSAPDDSKMNNYSTQGNVNPYTGQAGTRRAYP